MLIMLGRMRLTYCVLRQGKALNVLYIIVYEMYRLPIKHIVNTNANPSAHALRAKIAFVLKRIVPLG